MEDKNVVIEKYKKQLAFFRLIGLVSFLAVFVYFLITILQCETFDKNVIVACLIFVGAVIVFCILFTFFWFIYAVQTISSPYYYLQII